LPIAFSARGSISGGCFGCLNEPIGVSGLGARPVCVDWNLIDSAPFTSDEWVEIIIGYGADLDRGLPRPG
jgi:hypothetical protein